MYIYSDATLNEFIINDHSTNATMITQNKYFELVCLAISFRCRRLT